MKRAGRNKRAVGKFRRPDIYKLKKKGNPCLQKCPKQNTSHRGCPIIIWTGLNIKIDIVQKVYD